MAWTISNNYLTESQMQGNALEVYNFFSARGWTLNAIAGMLGGAGMVFVWNLLVRPLGGIWDIYELLPAFIFSSICIVVVSLLSPKPSEEIEREFEEVKVMGKK